MPTSSEGKGSEGKGVGLERSTVALEEWGLTTSRFDGRVAKKRRSLDFLSANPVYYSCLVGFCAPVAQRIERQVADL